LSGKAERGIFYRMAAQAADYTDNKDGKQRQPVKVYRRFPATAAQRRTVILSYHIRTSLSSGCEKTTLERTVLL